MALAYSLNEAHVLVEYCQRVGGHRGCEYESTAQPPVHVQGRGAKIDRTSSDPRVVSSNKLSTDRQGEFDRTQYGSFGFGGNTSPLSSKASVDGSNAGSEHSTDTEVETGKPYAQHQALVEGSGCRSTTAWGRRPRRRRRKTP
jgi:hypothetical protein